MEKEEIQIQQLQEMLSKLKECTLCPRECHVNRLQGDSGVCHEDSRIFLARAALHMWEEPCISGKEGSGAVFFCGCSVGCVFCQNRTIASGKRGKVITPGRLRDIFLELQEKGANNINLVTPTHYVPQIVWAVQRAREDGLQIPIVYNTSGYEKVDTLKQLEGIVDIYLPDFKYYDSELSKRLSKASDYFEVASNALAEMVRQIPKAHFDNRGIMQKGIIVRHLVLPGYKEDSKRVIEYLYKTYGNQIYLSILNQYTPIGELEGYKELQRKTTTYEYQHVVEYARNLGVENGFIQEGATAKESFIPEFDESGVSGKQVVIMNFSHVYEAEKFYLHEKYHWIDCSGIEAVNCYCSKEAEKEIKAKIDSYDPYGIHFIDSGNFHYVSKLWIEKIREPFALVVMDHHPDMQPSLFQQIISCGSWVKEVLDTNPYIKKVVLLGAETRLAKQIDPIYADRIICYNEEKLQTALQTIKEHKEQWQAFSKKHMSVPVYLSIDKDVLSPADAKTNWDQGSLSLLEMEQIIRIICEQEQLIGVDICGECTSSLCNLKEAESEEKNSIVNETLLRLLERLL